MAQKARQSRANQPVAAWRTCQDQAVAGAQDMKAISASLLRLARGNTAYEIVCSPSPSATPLPLSAEALNQRFRATRERAEAAFLGRQQRAGRSWRSISQFLDGARQPAERAHRENYVKLLTWRASKGSFLEAICLLAALTRFRPAGNAGSIDLFGRNGPIPVLSDRQRVFLWTRAALPNTRSGLRAHPDLLCTREARLDRAADIEWIIECKYRGAVSSHELRAEFGKAFDLESPAYTIVTYDAQPESIVAAARELGLDMQVFPLGSELRGEYLSQRRSLETDLADKLQLSQSEKNFARRVLAKGESLERKLLP